MIASEQKEFQQKFGKHFLLCCRYCKSELDNDIHTEGKAEQIRISNMGALNLSDALFRDAIASKSKYTFQIG
jgi:hypothetical protein